ncbi:MAG: hypothetical protein ACFFD4_06580 [Candidatus Odinarchaeota archaeon]
MPVCKKCKNYVLTFPCSHCGGNLPLTHTTEEEIESVISPGLQARFSDFDDDYDFFTSRTSVLTDKSKQSARATAPDSVPGSNPGETTASRRKVSQNLPLDHLFPSAVQDIALTSTEQKVYLQLSIEYHIIMDEAASFQEGVYNWNRLLPDRLQRYGLTVDGWEKISSIGDGDERIQEQLDGLIEKLFPQE